MRYRSATEMLTILQEHGLSLKLLALLTEHCEEDYTGHITLHTSMGRFSSFEQRIVGRIQQGAGHVLVGPAAERVTGT